MTDGFGSRAILKCIGLLFLIFGVAGFSSPKLFGTYLSPERCGVLIGLSLIMFLVSVYGSHLIIRILSLLLCLLFGGLAYAGFYWGTPGVRSLGIDSAEARLLRLFEKKVELGMVDHRIHLILAILFCVAFILPKSFETEQPEL